ncbi:IS256 family transposase [Adlercreutzia caecimuris]|uniref:IS256 family transposase n=1 Tax=Adlercreutzia caecimuris TaxID=671266 RepID=UPI001364AD04|nr:IS256 family transposase [Adlercreutzia caecimuris]NBJ67849.1 IS256 family transposase [Adlercreutzia caecimuris]
MDSLEHGTAAMAEIPRFDDGMVNIQELIRIMAESLVNEIMDAQAEDACADGNQRNGYRERTLVTSVGAINLRIPKLRRGSYFPEDLLVRYSRVDRAVIAAVSEMVTNGVSTRKAGRVAASLGIDRMSASQVSRICGALDEIVADLQGRDLSDVAFPYVWVDATYVKCRDGGHVSSCALVTAIGAGSDGYRRLLGLDAVDTESHAGWLAFLRSLRERGVGGVLCVTSDAHEGLRRAIEEVFPGAAWQRCVVHLMRNAASCAPTRQKRAAVLAILHAVFDERDPALVRELYRLACGEMAGICPRAADLLEDAEADALAYLDFPYAHHRRLRTSNVQERANREIKRRSRVVQVFPSRRSLIRMLGAVLSEMDEDWASRRWFAEESIALATSPSRTPLPAPSYDGTAEEHARRIMEVVVTDNPIGRRAA